MSLLAFWFKSKVDNPTQIILVKYQDDDLFQTFYKDAETVASVLNKDCVTQFKCACGRITFHVPSIHNALKWLAGNHPHWSNAYPDGSEDVACKCGEDVKVMKTIGLRKQDVLDNWQKFSQQISMLTCVKQMSIDDDEEDYT